MGFTCSTCRDADGRPIGLPVAFVRHPEPGVTRRVRRCVSCRAEVVTWERCDAPTRTITAALAEFLNP